MRWMMPENEPAYRSEDKIEAEKGIALILNDINDLLITSILILIKRVVDGLLNNFLQVV